MIRKKILSSLLLLPLAVSGCGTGTKGQTLTNRYTLTYLDYFDTRTEITGYAATPEAFEEAMTPLVELLRDCHQLFDIYHSYEGMTNLCTVNASAAISPVEVSDRLFDLLTFSVQMYDQTEGQVNIAMGSLLSLWHDYREEGLLDPQAAALPTEDELLIAAAHTDIRDLLLAAETNTVAFADPDLSLDVGGIAKGYTVQKMADYARELGMDHLLLSVGGNIATVGTKADGTDWVLGIQNPDTTSEEAYVQKVACHDQSLVTSGDYQRYYTVDGKRYCHIIDPDTRMPAEYVSSVTILTQDSGLADALSTAVFNMPIQEGLSFVNGWEGVEAMWILPDGSFLYSDHFEDSVPK